MAKRKVRIPVKKRGTGYNLRAPAKTRRRVLLSTTDKRMTMDRRYLQAGRRANALAVLNKKQNPELAKIAKSDAEYFFRKAKKTK